MNSDTKRHEAKSLEKNQHDADRRHREESRRNREESLELRPHEKVRRRDVAPRCRDSESRGTEPEMVRSPLRASGRSRVRREPLKVKLRGIMFGGLRTILTDPAIDPAPYSCFNCWQFGHRLNERPRPITRLFCFNCGRRGVSLFNCPRCGEAYRAYLQRGVVAMYEEEAGSALVDLLRRDVLTARHPGLRRVVALERPNSSQREQEPNHVAQPTDKRHAEKEIRNGERG